MTGEDFAQLLNEFTHSAESGDGARFASHFTADVLRPARRAAPGFEPVA